MDSTSPLRTLVSRTMPDFILALNLLVFSLALEVHCVGANYVIFGGTPTVVRTRLDPIVNPGAVCLCFSSLLVRHSRYFRCLTRQTTRLVAMFTMFLVATDFQKPTITTNRSWAIVQRCLYHRTTVTIGWYVSGRDDMALIL